MYIELIKKALTDTLKGSIGEYQPISKTLVGNNKPLFLLDTFLRRRHFLIAKHIPHYPENRENGWDWPPPLYADTMVGMKRLNNIQFCVSEVIKNNIEGDFIETGVWRGGSSIFMRALLKVFNVTDKTVWVADSFEGLPKPDVEKYPLDKGDTNYMYSELAISLETVQANFKKYDLLDDKVKFLKGWFKDTLPTAPVKKLALARLDGDMYESTMDALVSVYPKLSVGGYIIIDDYANPVLPACKQAVNDYREKHGINEEIIPVDWTGVYWKRER